MTYSLDLSNPKTIKISITIAGLAISGFYLLSNNANDLILIIDPIYITKFQIFLIGFMTIIGVTIGCLLYFRKRK